MRAALLCMALVFIFFSPCQGSTITPDSYLPSDFTEDTTIVSCVGTLKTEGDLLVRSNGIREVFGATGKGIRVGVIGNGVMSLELSQAMGELGQVTVFERGIGDEGTAMLEIIHDIAPDAELCFHAYGGDKDQFKHAVSVLADAGCRIICDDLYFFKQPFLEDGDVADHIRAVLKKHPDCIYVTVSGNFASLHYQKPWKPGISIGYERTIHDFGEGYSAIPMTLLPGDEVIITLQWDDPWGYALHDYDLFLTDPNRGEVVATSMNIQDETGEPFEHLVFKNAINESRRVSLSIVRNGENVTPNILEMYIRNIDARQVETDIVKDPADSIFGHAALEEVVTVGSVRIEAPHLISPDSSQGPVTIRIPEPSRRWKPDICAPTNVQVSGAGSFPVPFPGTSAAAPHVAGVIAQLLSSFPDLTRNELTEALYENAFDLGEPGWDPVYGYGLVDAVKSFQALMERENSW